MSNPLCVLNILENSIVGVSTLEPYKVVSIKWVYILAKIYSTHKYPQIGPYLYPNSFRVGYPLPS